MLWHAAKNNAVSFGTCIVELLKHGDPCQPGRYDRAEDSVNADPATLQPFVVAKD